MRRRWATWERVQEVVASRSAQLILFTFSEFSDASGRCRATMPRLCERTGLHARTIQRHLNQLEAEGLIHRQIGGGAHASTYFLIEPTPSPPLDLSRFRSGQVLMLGGLRFEGHGGFPGDC